MPKTRSAVATFILFISSTTKMALYLIADSLKLDGTAALLMRAKEQAGDSRKIVILATDGESVHYASLCRKSGISGQVIIA
jgi:hypothetical protein